MLECGAADRGLKFGGIAGGGLGVGAGAGSGPGSSHSRGRVIVMAGMVGTDRGETGRQFVKYCVEE